MISDIIENETSKGSIVKPSFSPAPAVNPWELSIPASQSIFEFPALPKIITDKCSDQTNEEEGCDAELEPFSIQALITGMKKWDSFNYLDTDEIRCNIRDNPVCAYMDTLRHPERYVY